MLGHDESLRVRQTYDHRLRDAIAATGNADLFQNIEIPVLVATVNCTFMADENCTLGTRPVQKHKRTQDCAPGRFDRHRPMASPRSGACRRRCRRFGFPVRAGKTPSSNGMPRSRAETWIQARAAPGPERASRLRRGSPGLDSGPLGRSLFRRCTALSATRSPPLAQTWHSKIEIRDQNRK